MCGMCWIVVVCGGWECGGFFSGVKEGVYRWVWVGEERVGGDLERMGRGEGSGERGWWEEVEWC